MDIIEDRFWMNVDGLCAQKGIKTPSELSRLMGRAYNYANRIRNGGSVLSESKAYEIAKALGVTLGYLVSSERLPSESIRIPIEGSTVCAILKAASVLPEEDLAATLLDLDKDSENLVLALLNERLMALASSKGL